MENSRLEEEITVYDFLDDLDIEYVVYRHEAMFTVADAHLDGYTQEGFNMKNLVVKDKKKGKYYMVVLEDDHRMDFKRLRESTGWTSKISFVDDDELFGILGVRQGACSIFNLINDKENLVTLVIEKSIGQALGNELMNFHPNINTATLAFTFEDMKKYLDKVGNEVIWEK